MALAEVPLIAELAAQSTFEDAKRLLLARIADVDHASITHYAKHVQEHWRELPKERRLLLAQIGIYAGRLLSSTSIEALFSYLTTRSLHEEGDEEGYVRSALTTLKLSIAAAAEGSGEAWDLISETENGLLQVLVARGRTGEAIAVLTEVRAFFAGIGDRVNTLTHTLSLAVTSVKAGLVQPALAYATNFSEEWDREAIADKRIDAIRDWAAQSLAGVSSDLYYRDEFAAALAVSGWALKLDPDLLLGLTIQGYAQLRLELYSEAVTTYRQLATLQPDRAFVFSNLSHALLSIDDHKEALETLSHAIELDPDRMRLFNRAQLRLHMGDWRGAIADAERVLDICSNDTLESEPTGGTSRFDYHRNMPPQDLADVAAFLKVKALVQGGEPGQAGKELERLASEGDDVTRAAAMRQQALMAAESGDVANAIDLLLEVESPGGHEDAELIELLIQAGRTSDAISRLSRLADKSQDPDKALSLLELIVKANEQDFEAKKWLAYARMEARKPRQAIEELKELIKERPDDADLIFWLGLCYVTTDEAGLEDWPTGEGFGLCLEHVSQACKMRPEDQEIRRLYLRIWDLLSRNQVFLMGFDMSALPTPDEGREAVKAYMASLSLAGVSSWGAAETLLRQGLAHASHPDLPSLRSRLSLQLADVYCRMRHFRAAQGAFSEARGYWFAALSPLSKGAIDVSLQHGTVPRGRLGHYNANLEVEFLGLYSVVTADLDLQFSLVEAEIAVAKGDHQSALQAIGSVEDSLREGGHKVGLASKSQAVVNMAILLRRLGESQRALKLLEHFAKDPEVTSNIGYLNTLGTLQVREGRFSEALTNFLKAHEREKNSAEFFGRALINVAECYLKLGKPKKALRALEEVPADSFVRNGTESWKFHVLAARSHDALRQPKEAYEAIQRSMTKIEEMRGQQARHSETLAFNAEYEWVYGIAASFALRAGDVAAALELIERSKSRAFLDQIHVSMLPIPEEARHIQERLENLREAIALLTELESQLKNAEPVDYGLVHVLQQKGMSKIVDKAGVLDPDAVTAAREQLIESAHIDVDELNIARVKSVAEASGSQVTMAGLAAMLPSGGALAEYWVTGEEIYCIVLVAGSSEPSVRKVSLTFSHLTEVLSSEPWLTDSAEWQVRLAPLLEPIGELVPAGAPVLIVPHQALHYVPFCAVLCEGQPLVDRNAISTSPSASILLYRQGQSPSLDRAVVFGDPRGDLVYAREEALAVAKMLDTRAYVGAEATRDQLVSMLAEEGLTCLHLACHGRYHDEDPNLSGVLLAQSDPLEETEDDVLTATDILQLKLPSLVVISACESGMVERLAGDELVGLIRAISMAGAHTILVTLWAVDDLSTSIVIERFYEEMRGGSEPAEALRKAQFHTRAVTGGELRDRLKQRRMEAVQEADSVRIREIDEALRRLAMRMIAMEADDAPGSAASLALFSSPTHWAAFKLVGGLYG